MAQLGQALSYLRHAIGGLPADLSDRKLLERYATTKEGDAFTLLVRRHGPMVLGVCRRVLGNDSDADDAFQATFVVLAHKAGSVWWQPSIANWLYTVAFRIASKSRVERARRRRHENDACTQRVEAMNENPAVHDLRQVLDEELDRLPEKFRMPLLLCCLQDQTIDEAAQQLGWTAPTVKGRLQRGRELLRGRLLRRGITLSAGVLATILTQGAVKAMPAPLLDATLHAAAHGSMNATVAASAQGALQSMFWMKVKTTVAAFVALGILTLGAALAASGFGDPVPVVDAIPAREQPPAEKKAQPKEPLILDNKSDGKTVSVPVGTIVEVHLVGMRDNTGWERGSLKGDALVHLNLQPKQPSRPGLQPLPFGSEFMPDAKAADRAIGTYVFIFEAAKEGRAELMMQYITPGGPGVTARLRSALIATFKVTIDVTAAKAKAVDADPIRDQKNDPPKHFTNSIGMKLVWIPPGSFMMGSPKEEFALASPKEEKERMPDEGQHKVTLTKGFYMGVYAVTQEEWQAVMDNNPSFFNKGERKLPVERVRWGDCQIFLKKLADKEKKPYRLLTEAEWEYACRAGTTTAFNFGANISTDQANYLGDSVYGDGKKGVYRKKTMPVGSFPANAWGLHDMHGNVHQWCQDWYGAYPQNDVVDPQGPATGKERVMRGGSWGIHPHYLRSASRYKLAPIWGDDAIGLRVCFNLELPAPLPAQENRLTATLTGYKHYNVVGLAFARDSKTLAIGTTEGVQLWDLAKRQEQTVLKPHAPQPGWRGLAFSPDGKLLAACGADAVVLWDMENHRYSTHFPSTGRALTWTADSKFLVEVGGNAHVKIWDVDKHRLHGHHETHPHHLVDSVAIAANGKDLALGTSGGCIFMKDAITVEPMMQNARPLPIPQPHWRIEGIGMNTAISPGCQRFAIAEKEATVILGGIEATQPQKFVNAHKSYAMALAFSPDCRVLASGAADKTVKLWDAITGDALISLAGHTDRISGLAFSPDGKTLASGSHDRTVKVWDVSGAMKK